jgi:hypothetical protein
VVTINPEPDTGTADDGIGGNWTFDLLQPIDGVGSQILTVGGSSSFGAGPTEFQILTTGSGGTGTMLAVISGWNTDGAGFDANDWFTTGDTTGIQSDEVNGSTSGWGAGNNNNFTTGEFIRVDFGALTDFDGVGGYEPPTGTFTGNDVSQANFAFPFFGATDDVSYRAYMSDGSVQAVHVADPTLPLQINAPAGFFINYVEFYVDSAGGSAKLQLVSVGIETEGQDLDLSFNATLTDGDGDAETVALAVTVENPEAPPPPLTQSSTFAGFVEEEQLGHVDAPAHLASFVGNEDTGDVSDNDDDTQNPPDVVTNFNITTHVATGFETVVGGVGPYTYAFDSSFEGDQALFTGPAGNVTSQGQNVFWDYVDADTMIGYVDSGSVADDLDVDDRIVFQFDITNTGTGAVSFTLFDNVDHPFGDDVETTRTLDLNGMVVATDSAAPTPNTLALNGSVGIVDDIPVAEDDSTTVEQGEAKSDVVLILDHSESMEGQRLADLKAAVADLFNSGHVNAVFLVSFSSNGTFHDSGSNGGWYTNLNDALTVVNGLTASGFTDYDSALATVQANFTAPPLGGDQLLSMFLSDGVPTQDNGTGSLGIDEDDTDVGGIGEETAWINFLNANGFDKSFAFGFGGLTDDDKANLEPIAWAPTETADNPYDADDASGATDPNVIIVADSGDLSDVLLTSVVVPASGNVLTNDGFGADGPLNGAGKGILSITVDGVVYTYDPVLNQITSSNPTQAGSTLEVDTIANGHLTFHFADGLGFVAGDYSYTPDSGLVSDLTETFHYVIADGDGDEEGADLSITIDVNDPPTDIIFTGNAGLSPSTNGDDTEIANNSVLFTLTGVDPDDLSGFVYTFNGNGTFGVTVDNGGAETFTMNSGTGVVTTTSLDYDNGVQTIVIDPPDQPRVADPDGATHLETLTLRLGTNNNGDTIDGSATTNDQVIYGFDGDDTLTGGSGNDWIGGGDDDDTITGGGGVDLIDVGGGNDNTVIFTGTGDFGDTISSFDSDGGQQDQIHLSGVSLDTLFDDGTDNDAIAFVSDNGTDNDNVAVNLNGTNEGLFLDGANSEGVANASLRDADAVAAEFSAEFSITAANGESSLLVINDTNANSASIWQYTEAGGAAGGANEISGSELTLIAVVNSNAAITTGNLDLAG